MNERRKAVGGHVKMRIETLAAAFAQFEQSAFPDIDAEDRKEVRAVFYAGAQAIVDIMDGIVSDKKERPRIARALLLELDRFAKEMAEEKP
jgi:hypothetical protein